MQDSAAADPRLASEVRWIRRLHATLVLIAVFYIGVIGAGVFIPLLLAILFSLVLAPAVRALCRLRIPRSVATIAVMAATLGVVGALLMSLANPARIWILSVPKTVDHVGQAVHELLRRPMQAASQATQAISNLTDTPTSAQPVRVVDNGGPSALWQAVSAAPGVLIYTIATLLLIYILLRHADTLLKKAVRLAPRRHVKWDIVEATRSAQHELSTYMLTIGMINITLGLLTAAALWWLGVANPLLWGGVAALFNFAPYVGPLMTCIALCVVGFSESPSPLAGLAVPGAFLVLHICESYIATPLLVGRRLALDPVVIFIALLALGSMWGVAGLLIAMPLLTCVKIIAERVPQLRVLAQLLSA
jgi:predicted PurR-regulated permease PerM